MADKNSIAEVARQVFDLLDPLNSDDRLRVIRGVLALFGEPAQVPAATVGVSSSVGTASVVSRFGPKAARWMQQSQISEARINDVFHVEDGAEVILPEMAGESKRSKTINCYLICGVRGLLVRDDPTFSEAEVVALCKRYKCHDSANHAAYRNSAQQYFSGDKSRFVLSAPGLKAAAALLTEL